MIQKVIGRLINNNDHKLNLVRPILDLVNKEEEIVNKMTPEDFLQQTVEWKEMLYKIESVDELSDNLNRILPRAYAMVREASLRTMNQRHRDVQILAGIVLHQGKVAEQKTGEGKTLTATLPLYLNSLTGRGSHLITPNDYLSKHGAGWYGAVYEYLGINVGVIVDDDSFVYDSKYINENDVDSYTSHLRKSTRAEAYMCDITYGTNSQFGFDYLRDNMSSDLSRIVQRNPRGDYWSQFFGIVDEVDSILIDFARTPLIISSSRNEDNKKYHEYTALAETLVKPTDYTVDEKYRSVTLTELGISKLERRLGLANLYETDFDTIHKIENSLRAKELYEKDKDYVVKDNQVLIVDQFTGRILYGNRWSDGLHQAVEAKEGVEIQSESKTVATISYQNYFRLYKKLAGMTGTAQTEAEELFKIYSLDVISIPTFKPVIRKDQPDSIYKSETAKYRAIARDIAERYKKGQPVLIGTVSVEKSQMLSTYLKKLNIPHQILNAKHHDREALIIAQAGKISGVTVSTNMAGRGVDIILGGDPYIIENYNKVVENGGLYVIGTERHESRRIDNQLRGRSGRQGDPGESRFYLSLQDDLMRIFGGERIESIMNTFKMDDNQPIESKIISRAIEGAQKKVETMNFDARRSTVDYDDVMNVQRESTYALRRALLIGATQDPKVNIEKLSELVKSNYPEIDIDKLIEENVKKYSEKIWSDVMTKITLDVIDTLWMDHIDTMDDLRSGVRLRSYGHMDTLVEYKREGRELFEQLQRTIWLTTVDRLSKIEVNVVYQTPSEDKKLEKTKEIFQGDINYGVADEAKMAGNVPQLQNVNKEPVRKENKPGRNDPCWCGSGKKYKNCHWPN